MSDLLQEIKDYLYSIRHSAVNAALAKSAKEYETYIKIVFDCEEAVLSLFRKLDREYWKLLERLEQLQTKAERYENALKYILENYHSEELDDTDYAIEAQQIAKKALEGKND